MSYRSPRWLVKEGMEDEARYLLERLRGEGSNEALSEFQNVCALAKLDREEPKQASYWSMLTGIGTGKAHTARRVQLVVWLQILQEWIGIAGITIYGPEIFTIAGISSKDRQWVSGLNNITYMVSSQSHPDMHFLPLIDLPVLHPHLCLHLGPHRSPLDALLGRHWARDLLLHCWRSLVRDDQCDWILQGTRRWSSRLFRVPLHGHLRCHVAYSPLAVSRYVLKCAELIHLGSALLT